MTEGNILDRAVAMARRKQTGFRSFCASVDLLGVREMAPKRPSELIERLNDLYEGLGGALELHPPPAATRACFAGDSFFVVRELTPEAQVEKDWPSFCGHLYALAAHVQHLEKAWGNPGVRVIVSYGDLVPLSDPEALRRNLTVSGYTRDWLLLTGVDDALLKCWQAEAGGSRLGFQRECFWHEDLGNPRAYLGSPILEVRDALLQAPELYPQLYREIVGRVAERTSLPP